MHDIRVRVNRAAPKTVVREMIRTCKGPRDIDQMHAILKDWYTKDTPHNTFTAYIRNQDWTLGSLMSLLSYQCRAIFGDWIDEEEFSDLWPAARHVIKSQGLLTVEVIRDLDAPVDAPDGETRAAALQV